MVKIETMFVLAGGGGSQGGKDIFMGLGALAAAAGVSAILLLRKRRL
jgi:hypothetical protein